MSGLQLPSVIERAASACYALGEYTPREVERAAHSVFELWGHLAVDGGPSARVFMDQIADSIMRGRPRLRVIIGGASKRPRRSRRAPQLRLVKGGSQ